MKKRDIKILNKFLRKKTDEYLFNFDTRSHDDFAEVHYYFEGYYITAIVEKDLLFNGIDNFSWNEPSKKFYKNLSNEAQEKLDKLILKNNVNNF